MESINYTVALDHGIQALRVGIKALNFRGKSVRARKAAVTCIFQTILKTKIISQRTLHHHHHHQDAKRSAVAFRRCDLSPKRAVFCQLQSVGHWYSCVPADLMDPGNGRSATSAFPIRRWSGTVLGFAVSLKDLVCWDVLCESGNMTEQSESSFANDGRGCQETGPAINLF